MMISPPAPPDARRSAGGLQARAPRGTLGAAAYRLIMASTTLLRQRTPRASRPPGLTPGPAGLRRPLTARRGRDLYPSSSLERPAGKNTGGGPPALPSGTVRAHTSTDPRETTMASNTEKTSPPAFGEGLRPTGTSLDPVDARPEPGPMTAAWGSCPAARHPGELLTRSEVCHVHADRAAAERCGVLLGGAPELVRLDKVPARGLPRGVVAVERNERPATSPPPGLGQPCWRRAVSSARRASTGRTRRPPPTSQRKRPSGIASTARGTSCARQPLDGGIPATPAAGRSGAHVTRDPRSPLGSSAS